MRTSEVLYKEHTIRGLDKERRAGDRYIRTSFDRRLREQRQLTRAEGRLFGCTYSYPVAFRSLQEIDPALYGMEGSQGFLSDAVRRGVICRKPEAIDGHNCWRVDIPAERYHHRYTIWLDPTIGFNPRRMESDYGPKSTTISSFRGHKQIAAGTWFPMEVQLKDYPDHRRVLISSIKVARIQVCRTIPKEHLLVKYPPGTVVEAGTSNQRRVQRW